MYINIQTVPRSKYLHLGYKNRQLIPYREIIAAFSESHTKHTTTLCGQNVEFFSVKPVVTRSNHWALED